MARYFYEYRSWSLRWVIDLIFALIEILITLRILLKLFGANAAAPFVSWIYETSQPLINPFQGIFPNPRLEGAYVIEISAIFAVIIYALINYIIIWVIDEISYRNERRLEE